VERVVEVESGINFLVLGHCSPDPLHCCGRTTLQHASFSGVQHKSDLPINTKSSVAVFPDQDWSPTLNPSIAQLGFILALSSNAILSQSALAQRSGTTPATNPVYLADAPVAVETIERAMSLAAQGSYTEASRVLSELIITQGDRLTPIEYGSEIWIPVRVRIGAVIAADAQLLDAYRRTNTPKAQRLLDDHQFTEASRMYWLTEPGLVGSLNQAQVLIESASFWSGLRVLDRLTQHPDASKHADRARKLTALAYRAQPNDRARLLLEQWSRINGQKLDAPDPFNQPSATPEETTSLRWKPIDPTAPELRIDGIVPRPIATTKLTPPPASEELIGIDDQPQAARGGAVTQPKPWTMPVVRGDWLITNDGITISCFDRFTLRPHWRVPTITLDTEEQDRTSEGIRSRIARTVEDMSSASIVDDVVYAAAGLARTGGRTGDDRLLALDLETGAILNQTRLEVLDPSLSESTIRGSIIIDGDTLIVAARKNLRRQRIVALSIIGIDRHTFEHLWTREIGSAGSLPFQQIGQISHSGVLDEGVVYWTDMMGLMCAVETATGDILWAKSSPTSDIYARYERDAWTASTPIVRDGSVYILGVDGQSIERIDQYTGETLSKVRSMTTGQGLYLVETPESIACINRTSIAVHDFDQFGVTKPRLMTPTGDGRAAIQGRVVSSGSKLIVPTESGLAVLDTSRAGGRESITLESQGIVVALDGQFLIADENTVSSYLSWDIAQGILNNRIEEFGDVHAAITLADLAYRSDHHDQIVPAIDRAISMFRPSRIAGEPLPNSQKLTEARDRLFSVIIDMVGLPESLINTQTASLPAPTRTELLKRTGTIARTVEQSLAYQMTAGAWHRASGEIPQAIRIYHGVLNDRALASEMWHGSGVAIRAELEATHQINQIVASHGRIVCAQFDELAAADLGALGPNEDAETYEQLARIYPWALTTPSVWAMAADRWFDSQNAPAAVRAASSGLDAINRLQVHGVQTDQPTIDSTASVLINGLLDSQRPGEASRQATRLMSDYPGLTILVNNQPIDAAMLSVGLSSGQPAPRLGSKIIASDTPILLTGSPVKSPIRTEFDTMIFFAPQLAQARMVQFTDGQPEVIWTRRSPDVEPPLAVVHNEFQTVLIWAPPNGDPESGSVESIGTTTGKTLWRIEGLSKRLIEHSIREPDELARIDGQFISPTEGVVQPDQMLSVCDGSVLVLVDRIGRAMGIDILTGHVLWKDDLPINRVHDLDLASGVLGITGMWVMDQNDPNGEVAARSPRIASIDARTGQTIHLLDSQTSTPRWVRVAPSGSLIVGTSQRVLSVSTRTGTLDWVVRNQSLFNTNAGWIIDGTLVVLDEFINLWPIGLTDGRTPLTALDTANRIMERGWVDVRSHQGNISVTASGGMGVFNHDGTTIGLDSEQVSWTYSDRAWGSDRVVLVGRVSNSDQDFMRIPIKVFDQHSAQMSDSIDLTLPNAIQRQPTVAQAANGVVVVGFGEVSILLQTDK
tara:strand:- start:62049 stop:66524 length:4476 start_codon:yes stop_codon:yes gene_type:complete